jgi:DNA-binding MarR family transcriptional regulator
VTDESVRQERVTEWLTPQQERTWRDLLLLTTRLPARLNRELLGGSGLSLADYDVLVRLTDAADGRLRIFELAQDLQWEQSRLSHHLGRMVKRGLIAREECGTDGRGAFVVLTGFGREAITRAAPAHVEAVRTLVFDALSSQQATDLGTAAARVLERLDASG